MSKAKKSEEKKPDLNSEQLKWALAHIVQRFGSPAVVGKIDFNKTDVEALQGIVAAALDGPASDVGKAIDKALKKA